MTVRFLMSELKSKSSLSFQPNVDSATDVVSRERACSEEQTVATGQKWADSTIGVVRQHVQGEIGGTKSHNPGRESTVGPAGWPRGHSSNFSAKAQPLVDELLAPDAELNVAISRPSIAPTGTGECVPLSSWAIRCRGGLSGYLHNRRELQRQNGSEYSHGVLPSGA